MGTKSDLNKMSWPAQQAALGDKMDALIALVNELKADYTALRVDVAAVRTQMLADLIDLAALHAAYEAHRADAVAHAVADATNTAAAPTAVAPAALTSTAIAAAAVDALT